MKRKKILITHPWMGRGGSEATAMWTLDALQDDFEVVFVTASPMDFEALNGAFGTKVDPAKIELVRAPKLPTVDGPQRLVHLQLRVFERFCRKLAREVDFCLSTYNPVQFGRPAVQLIGDFSFSEEMRKRLYIHGANKFRHRETLLRKLYLALGRLIEVPQVPLRERGDLVLANSQWSASQLSGHFGYPEASVLYPPVVLPVAPPGSVRDQLGFVCLGRIVPEKEIDRIIAILEEVREAGFPVTLRLIGALDDSSYSRSIRALLAERDWIIPEGFLGLEDKQRLLASQTFALHACRIEAFGIAVAEMASMGCIPIVPDTGGAGEIVPFPELQFASNGEAAEKIIALLRNPDALPSLRESLSARISRFGPEEFQRMLREHLFRFTGLQESAIHADPEKNLAATH